MTIVDYFLQWLQKGYKMKQKLVIFGNSEFAALAHYYFKRKMDYEVVAFTVDKEYIKEDTFDGLPVIPFERLVNLHSQSDTLIFVSLGYSNVNALRKEKFLAVKNLGYRLASYISPHAIILNNGHVGENCFIMEGNVVQPFAQIGSNVIIAGNSFIGHHSRIGDHCFIASNVVVSGHTSIEEQCFLGASSTIRDQIVIGAKCVVGAGTLILVDAEAEGVYIGTPSKREEFPSSLLSAI